MLSAIHRIMTGLKASTSGNATLLVALGMPVLIGGSGLAVDTAQYYMWKRDLQFAVDQAALAGGWENTRSSATLTSIQSRALQEYNANVQSTGAFDSGPTTTRINYSTGTNNAVKVVATASKFLPFSRIVMGRPVTVRVEATAYSVAGQAAVTTTTTLSSLSACLIALNPSSAGAFTLGGNASGSVSCGGAALSSDPNAAIRENGNPSALFSTLTATGGIEGSLLNNVNNIASNLRPNTTGLVNPFDGATNPTGNGIARTYSCPAVTSGSPAVTTYTATQKVRTVTTYVYKKGNNASTATTITYTSGTGYLPNSDDNPGVTTSVSRTSAPYVNGGPTQAGPTVGTAVSISGNGNNTIWRVPTVTTYTTISNAGSTVTPAVPANDGTANLLPGTYSNISIACKTVFSSGIYVITGSIDFSQNQIVSGSDVMIVMTSANSISNINSNTNLSFSGITSNTLINTYGYSATNAAKFAGVLFWDPLSTTQIKFNGNSTTNFNGIFYTPKRSLWFNGTSAVSGKCMMLVADTLMLDGTTNLSSFCSSGGFGSPTVRPQTTTTVVTQQAIPASVKLVA